MSAAIYLLQNDGTLIEMASQPYDSERLLQQLLAEHTHLLGGEQMDLETPRRWLLVSRELALAAEEGGGGRWAVDHLFLDQDGVPTIVEVKRCSDSRIRREVVGEDADPEEFWQRVKTNLQAGRVRLVFVADRIPPELRRVVEFLNTQMDPAEVLALEIEQFVGSGLTTLVPRIVGQTAEAQRRKTVRGGPEKQWDETSFFDALEEREPDAVRAARQIQAWAKENGARLEYGRGKRSGSIVPAFTHAGRNYYLFAIWTYGSIEIYFQWLKEKPPFDEEGKRRELLKRLNAIAGVQIPPDGVSRRPSIPLDVLAAPDAMKPFVATLDWLLEEIRATGTGLHPSPELSGKRMSVDSEQQNDAQSRVANSM